MAELKPCPFCGGVAYVQYNFYLTAEVVCSNCGSKGTACCGVNIDERAIEAWNRRADNGQTD